VQSLRSASCRHSSGGFWPRSRDPVRLLQLLLAAPPARQERAADADACNDGGVGRSLWTVENLYDAVMKQQAGKKHAARVAKLIAKLEANSGVAYRGDSV